MWRKGQLRRSLSRYFLSKTVAELARERPELDTALKTSWLYCLLVQVRDESPEDIQRNTERAVPIYLKHNGVVMDLMGSLHFVAFGTHIFSGTREQCSTDSKNASAELLASLGNDVRIVPFDGDISYGLIGSKERIAYSLLVPNFHRLLEVLLNSEFGIAVEAVPFSE